MKHRTAQLGVRKNPDSPRVHGLRLSGNSSSSLFSDIEDSQERELTKDELFSSQSAVSSREPKQMRFKRDAGFEPLLDASEAASLLRIHPKTLQKLARIGYLPAYRVGKFWRYRASDLEMWLRSDANSDRQLADCVDFTSMKTEASLKPVPMAGALLDALRAWSRQAPYRQPGDWVFASPDMDGKQPYWPETMLKCYVHPAAKR